MQEEIWRDIPGYEGSYQASSLGNIRSLDRVIGGTRFNGRIMVACMSKRSYYSVILCKRNNMKRFSIHQLVAMSFLNHIPNGNNLVVDHINGDKLNNTLSNLRIITHSENLTNIKRKKRATLVR